VLTGGLAGWLHTHAEEWRGVEGDRVLCLAGVESSRVASSGVVCAHGTARCLL